jgi:hypothetical protein
VKKGGKMDKQIQIKADDQALKGYYSNLVMINHAKEEFVFDFINVTAPAAQLLSRFFMSPGHARRLLRALEENVNAYEDKFGKIEETEPLKKDIGFTT